MIAEIRRLHLGHFTAPEQHVLAGQRVVVSAFVVRHPDGVLLFDTGIGVGDDETEAFYKPVRRDVRDELRAAGVDPADVRLVANCHLHFDHAGWNLLFPKLPIFTQQREYELAHGQDYTFPPRAYDFDGASFELLDGEAEVLPGVRVVPTPGHTGGHQSLIVDTAAGRVVLAGQAFDLTT